MSTDVDTDVKVVFVEPTADLTAHINLLVDVSTKTMVYKAPLEMSTSLVNAYEGELVEGVPQVATMGVTYTKVKTLNNTNDKHLDNHDRRLVDETYTNVDNTFQLVLQPWLK